MASLGTLSPMSVLLGLLLLSAPKPTNITFVRHGETVANATGKYNMKTLNTFSEKGKKGVADLTARLLKQPKYDLILVSPSERALRTVAPYLKATRRKAVVWPLLYECCTGKKEPIAKGPLPYGPKIDLPKDIAAYFIIEPGHDKLPNAPKYGMGLVQVKDCLAEFNKRYLGKNLLIVGHSGHGGQFIYGLTGLRKHVENTKEIKFSLK